MRVTPLITSATHEVKKRRHASLLDVGIAAHIPAGAEKRMRVEPFAPPLRKIVSERIAPRGRKGRHLRDIMGHVEQRMRVESVKRAPCDEVFERGQRPALQGFAILLAIPSRIEKRMRSPSLGVTCEQIVKRQYPATAADILGQAFIMLGIKQRMRAAGGCVIASKAKQIAPAGPILTCMKAGQKEHYRPADGEPPQHRRERPPTTDRGEPFARAGT